MKAVWAISFKQSRDVYHDCSPFTATMCACAQFTVVVFPRGLWYGFIGCSRCPFGCKCIYLNRKIYTRILEDACVFFIYCNIMELSFPRKKKSTPVYDSLVLPPPFFFSSHKQFFYSAVPFKKFFLRIFSFFSTLTLHSPLFLSHKLIFSFLIYCYFLLYLPFPQLCNFSFALFNVQSSHFQLPTVSLFISTYCNSMSYKRQ